MNRYVCGLLCILLLGGMLIQFVPTRHVMRFPPGKKLYDLIPGGLEGWEVHDAPLADTEFLKDKVKQILKYDDSAYRIYRREGLEIGMLVLFWKPGSQDLAEVGVHNPDVCWPASGWQLISEEDTISFDHGTWCTQPGQMRKFGRDGAKDTFVAFWHLHGGRRSGHALGDRSNWRKRAPVMLDSFLNTSFRFITMEQYMIRITCNRPFAEVESEELFKAILECTQQFGLADIAGVTDLQVATNLEQTWPS